MLFKRYYNTQLAQASYLVACEQTGEALIVDPNRDIAFYLDEARRERVRIRYVTETHIHADFLSGSRELALETHAQLCLSDEGGDNWRYSFATEAGARLLCDADVISFGRVRVRALHTPGHTPEHLSFLVTDLASSPEPVGMLSGDFLFVGDVGRPDLLERAAQIAGTMESAARDLYKSLQLLREFPDYLQIWPGHGAGSACGKSLGAMPQSTLGYERISNWALRVSSEQEFVDGVLSGQPAPPKYFAEMKKLNKEGPAILGGVREPERLNMRDFGKLAKGGALIVDTRSTASFAKLHIADSINIPLNKSFPKWAGSFIPYDRDFVLIVDAQNMESAKLAAHDLAMIGLDSVKGFATHDIIAEWQAAGHSVATSSSIASAEAAEKIRDGEVILLDVRDENELVEGQIPGALHIPLSTLIDRKGEVPHDKPVIVYCQGGSRSAIAASILQADGVEDVSNLSGGFTGWQKAGVAAGT